MKKSRKAIMAVLAMMLMLVFTACSSEEESGSGSEESASSDSGALGAYEVVIKDYELVKDYDGNDAIAIYYDFTNNGEESASFDIAFIYKAFQNGVELESTTVYLDEESFDMMDESTMTEIKPGVTLEVISTHKLNDSAGAVDVEVEEFTLVGGDAKVTKTFEIAQ